MSALGDYDVLASTSYAELDGKGYRASAERSLYLANTVSRVECPFEEQ